MKYADPQLEALAKRPSPFGDDPSAQEARASLDERAAQKQPGPKMDTVRDIAVANTDLTGSHPSMRENASGGGLDPKAVRWFNSQWVPDESRWGEEGVSPLAAADFSGMPPTLIVSAERDPLRDELEAYAARLREAGTEVTARREPGMIHNFLQMDEASRAAAAAGERIGQELGDLLRPGR